MIDPARVFRGWTPDASYLIDPREHVGIVVWCIDHYGRVSGLPFDDVWQIAWETMLACARRYDGESSFAAYVTRSILGEFKNQRRKNRRVSKPGFSQVSRVYLFCAAARLAGTLSPELLRETFPMFAKRPDHDIARIIDWCVGADTTTDAPGVDLADDAADPGDAIDAAAWDAILAGFRERLADPRKRLLFERRVLGDPKEPENSMTVLGQESGGLTRARMQQLDKKMRSELAAALTDRHGELLMLLRPSQRERLATEAA